MLSSAVLHVGGNPPRAPTRRRQQYTSAATVSTAQITALYTSFALEWPSTLFDGFDALSSLNFNVELLAPACSVIPPQT